MMPADPSCYTISELKGPPFVGLLLPALKDTVGFMMDLSLSHGDVVSFHIMGQQGIQVNHPDLIHYILVDNHKNYRKSKPYVRFESAIGLGLLTSNGDKWKRDRQKIQPMFNRERISGYYFDVVNEVSEKYKQKWLEATKNGPFDIVINEEMARITTEVILKSIFGHDIDDEEVISLHESYGVLIEYLRNIRLFPSVDLRKALMFPSSFKFRKALANVDSRIAALADKYRSAGGMGRHDMLSLLVEAQKSQPDYFSDKDVRDHCVSMVFAGFESTSIFMQWFWYLLDDRADIKYKLREHITQHAPCTSTSDSKSLTFTELMEMDYLSMVYKETMRLYPPFWMTGREPIEDDMLGGLRVPKGTAIVLPELSMHRHPRWWHDPHTCIPERFTPENEAKIVDGAYFPFSLGPRKCSGHSFVDMEAKTIMAKLLPLFDVMVLNKLSNPLLPGISLKLKNPVRVRVSRANS
jgi:cytochrome P450